MSERHPAAAAPAHLRLFVAGTAPASLRAIANARDLCRHNWASRPHLEIVDIIREPAMAQAHQIAGTPTMVRLHPLPVRRLLGDLSNRRLAIAALSDVDLPFDQQALDHLSGHSATGMGAEWLLMVGTADPPFLRRDQISRDRLFSGISIAAFTARGDGTLLSVNRRLANMLRTPAGLLSGAQLVTYFIAEDAATLRAFLALGRGRRNLRLERGDGRTVPVRVAIKRLDADDDLLFGLIYDRSVQSRALVALRQAHDRLSSATEERERAERMLRQAQRMEAVGQLTSGVAHDFNNLLQTIMAQLELLQDRLGCDIQGNASIESALAAAERGARLTHHLLAFSRKQMLQPRAVDVGQLIRSMAEMLRRTLGPDITVRTVEPEGLIGFADPVQLEACILHIAVNARDAMPDGGELTVEGFTARVDQLGASETMPEGDYVVIAMRDTGTGIPAPVLARVFEPFFSTKPVGKGSGLGLPMVLGYARQSGGDVRIESEPGHGTRVEIYLPLTAGSRHETAPRPETLPEPMTHAARILLVDDRPDVTTALAQQLQGIGLSVTCAATAAEALRVIGGPRPIDALVAEHVAANMSGVDLARQGARLRPGLRCLLITGFLDIEALGPLPPGVTVLQKPFSRKTLIERVTALAAHRRPADFTRPETFTAAPAVPVP